MTILSWLLHTRSKANRSKQIRCYYFKYWFTYYYDTLKLISFLLAMVLLGALMVPVSIGNYVAYSSTDDDEDDRNDSKNQRCYHAGFEAGQGGSYNQTQQSDCGSSGEHYAHAYYQGFIQGCISSGGGSYFACNDKTTGPP